MFLKVKYYYFLKKLIGGIAMKILAFGEILWDIFGDDYKIGGAPFNFSAHCAKLGAEMDFVTSVGYDELGLNAVDFIEKYGINTKFVNKSKMKTGRCQVTLNGGIPHYNLVTQVSYDDICLSEDQIFEICNTDYDYLYCGTLALRNKKSADTLFDILGKSVSKLVVDVNIRQNFYTSEILKKLFDRAETIKISREELKTVSTSLELNENQSDFVKEIFATFKNVIRILVTLDKDGALCYLRNGAVIHSKKPENKEVSTVGAGDSFTAAYIFNICNGETEEFALNKAVELSDYVVGFKEAIPD